MRPHTSTASAEPGAFRHSFLGTFRFSRRAIDLVWSTSRPLTFGLALLTLIAGVLPAVIAFVGAQIVDAVVAAAALAREGSRVEIGNVFRWVILEAALVVAMAAAQRGISFCQSLLRAQLGQRVNEMILDKALTLELAQFEDSEFYDKLTRARREASSRPLSLVTRTFGLVQNLIALVSFGVLLVGFSPWAMLVLLLAGLPSFIAETRFSGEAFTLFRWRSPDTRMQLYLETVIAREDHAKEVKLFGLGPLLLARYRAIFHKLYAADRALTLRRDLWGLGLGVIGTLALYGAYAWIAWTTVFGRITLGQMTMYLMLFRQGQAAVSAMLSAIGGMYEDNLYLSTLYEYLETPVRVGGGAAVQGPDSRDGIRFEAVSFTYPGADAPTLHDINLHIRPGESLALVGQNGSGKTTLIKLLTRLYAPDQGRILLDGLDLAQWNENALRQRIGVIFQDFARYQMLVGENVGAGDVTRFEDRERWREASDKGMASAFIDSLPQGFETQLGKWFKDGRELSGGQWQKIALARAFMREQADILVLDEPTAAMDAQAEATIFEHFSAMSSQRIVILISHRFSTVRMAEQIVVIQDGRIIEHGNHAQLLAQAGHYAHLFALQAKGYL
ncbi:MAG TPA: ABC transporter ATP-binding protein [Dokdonella sp.]|jgi:ATP-binding cassette subfamily B protein|nr:ABC transporter ATP-binding protein [Rhodanobacteraceae bacterium]HPW04150.1 ABC transporter ATP-binding protein [Dokdonella sp.]HQV49534.1 ABC transporter ATP-binding protein [Dokdonella sp.]HQX33937.1 ABC transporter ATP-binding protein [Dokdonella sp.]